MAKRRKALPARQPRDRSRDDSLLLRSAESLGRVIGALQRQLDSATKRLSETAGEDINRKSPAGKEPKERSRQRKNAKTTRPKSGTRKRAASKTTRRR